MIINSTLMEEAHDWFLTIVSEQKVLPKSYYLIYKIIISETFMSLRIFPMATFIYMPGELGLGYFDHTQSSFKCMHFCLNNCFSLYLGGMDTQETTKPALVFDGALNFENSSYCLYCQ